MPSSNKRHIKLLEQLSKEVRKSLVWGDVKPPRDSIHPPALLKLLDDQFYNSQFNAQERFLGKYIRTSYGTTKIFYRN